MSLLITGLVAFTATSFAAGFVWSVVRTWQKARGVEFFR